MSGVVKTYWASSLGMLEIISGDYGLRSISLKKDEDESLASAERDAFSHEVINQLEEYFSGERKVFHVPLDISGHPTFYKLVWKELTNIPYGQTRSYAEVARSIGNPSASRAVGMANRHNPLPIIIPCHRVIGSNGSMTGYMYGNEVKTTLLALENPNVYGHQTRLF